jgi:hypothetical protein
MWLKMKIIVFQRAFKNAQPFCEYTDEIIMRILSQAVKFYCPMYLTMRIVQELLLLK